MRIIVAIALLIMIPLPEKNFKTAQLRYPRVKEAYVSKQKMVNDLLASHGIRTGSSEIMIRVFKIEKKLELWAGNKGEKFVLLKTYDICATSGNPGPKREMGDNQTPEGFYFINRFNPSSNFYLSLGINYPNASDKILGRSGNLGGDIFIHGNCVTIGCIPVTDDKIKELYVFAVEAKNNGQKKIPVHIFPARLNEGSFKILAEHYKSDKELITFWENLRIGYEYFERSKELPAITVLKSGLYDFK